MSKSIHHAVSKLGIEELFVKLRGVISALRKFVPIGLRQKFSTIGKFVRDSSFYPKNDDYFVTRENTSSVEEVVNFLVGIGYSFKGEFYNDLISYAPVESSELYQYIVSAEYRCFERVPMSNQSFGQTSVMSIVAS
ncbi:MAG TPA: hypothetical protein VFZ52_15115 [Chryseolinea sp.]